MWEVFRKKQRRRRQREEDAEEEHQERAIRNEQRNRSRCAEGDVTRNTVSVTRSINVQDKSIKYAELGGERKEFWKKSIRG